MTQLSYKNDPQLKKMMVEEMKKHQDQDSLIKGTYGIENGNFKGCAVGCAIQTLNAKLGKKIDYGSHSGYSKELDIPEWLVRLEDYFFEGLPKKESIEFPAKFLEAIPIGKDLEPIRFEFLIFILGEMKQLVLSLKIEEKLKKQVLMAINQSCKVNKVALNNKVFNKAPMAARAAAWDSARAAARAAEDSAGAAWSAARAAARAAEDSAWAARAAWSAAWAAEAAAGDAAYIRYSEKLLELLRRF